MPPSYGRLADYLLSRVLISFDNNAMQLRHTAAKYVLFLQGLKRITYVKHADAGDWIQLVGKVAQITGPSPDLADARVRVP